MPPSFRGIVARRYLRPTAIALGIIFAMLLAFLMTMGVARSVSVSSTTVATPLTFDISLMTSIYNDDAYDDIVRLIEANPSLLEVAFVDGTDPMHWAVIMRRADLVQYLLPRVRDPFFRTTENTASGKRTPIELAIADRQIEIIKIIVQWCENDPAYTRKLRQASDFARRSDNADIAAMIDARLAK